MNQNIKTLKYIHVLSRTVTLFPSLSTEVTSMTCFFPSLVCLPVETPVTLMLRNHSSKILCTTLIFLYVKNGTATGLLNHATQNILVAVGSWSEKLLDFLKFSRQSGPYIFIILLKKLMQILVSANLKASFVYSTSHVPSYILCKLIAHSLSSSKYGVNTHLN